jgi:hypothetical protein
MDKQLFDDAIGEVPPSSVDVDAVITRGRRADRLRRVANPAVAAGVAVVLAVGAIAYTMTRGDDGAGSGGIGVGGSPTSTESSTGPRETSASNQPAPSSGSGKETTTGTPPPNGPVPTPPTACSRPDLETAAELNSRLGQVVASAVQAQRSDMPLAANPGMEYPNGTPRGALEFFQVNKTPGTDQPICDVDSYSMARATTNGPEGAGNVLVAVQPSFYDAATSLSCDDGATEEISCEIVTTPNGDRIKKASLKFEGGTSGNRVDVIRADGTSVTVTIDDIGTSIKSGDGPTATAIPLTLDQLVAIATAPGMTMFP